VREPNPKTEPNLASLNREKSRLRKIGLVVLLLGLAVAGLVYWLGNRSNNNGLEEFQQATTRAETRQMEMLYGTSGGLMEDFVNALKRPGNQAMAILGVTVFIAAGCFYLSRPVREPEDIE
jgi:flagellar basal body-associated protein FliL